MSNETNAIKRAAKQFYNILKCLYKENNSNHENKEAIDFLRERLNIPNAPSGYVRMQDFVNKLRNLSRRDAWELLRSLTFFERGVTPHGIINDLLREIRNTGNNGPRKLLEKYVNLFNDNDKKHVKKASKRDNIYQYTMAGSFLKVLMSMEDKDAIERLANQFIARELLIHLSVPGSPLKIDSFDYSLIAGLPDPNSHIYTNLCEKDLDFIAKKLSNPKPIEDLLEILKVFSSKINPHDRKLKKDLSMIIELIGEKEDKIKRQLKKLSERFQNVLKYLFFFENECNTNEIEEKFAKLYKRFMSNEDSVHAVVQPIVGALRETVNRQTNIYTNIFFFENFLSDEGNVPFTKEDFQIHQNLEMDGHNNLQLVYYVCFKRSHNRRKRGSVYRMHKFSIRNEEVRHHRFNLNQVKNHKCKDLATPRLNMNEIDEVMAFVVNVNPEASRGTSTTVKDVHKNPS